MVPTSCGASPVGCPAPSTRQEGSPRLLADRLREAGYAAKEVKEAVGGVVAIAGLVTLQDGTELFAKTLLGPDQDVFPVESIGLSDLHDLGGANTPDVLCASPRLLVLEKMQPRRDDEHFWEQLASMLATLHMSTASERFGWHRDGWLGRLRQDNTWETDGHTFFGERRILRRLPEPLVEAAFNREERQALERLCEALPELVPPQPPCLTHGDLWQENVVATSDGAPVLIDPAVSYNWPEVDLSMLWCSPRAAASERFFAVYQEIAPLQDGWEERMPILHLRELLSVIAHDDDWGAVEAVRKIIAPFRRSCVS
ncbi:fructosamine kinase family protein [Streptomyces sp. NBC_00121]|uniref:fructosamine kinase family protein n=1 Tax=unclassified Streptomyces TaxID=2593676 RepID=UPI0028C3A3B1|nr:MULTISPECIES: fructosamine kinase family protein [unclassified Streptomyces]WNO62524.1 fructosamine kinase family protein [Streptomyces sp. AM2-3-1]WSC67107.1 fructosamine kinase family protein [Streptomyces sp. NBC_01760]WTI84990.1 fructosamine kinase family protein [Streptomyces sp. NBC_00724]